MSKDILITGSHRSGSTWVGSVINKSSETELIMEPFNIENKLFLFDNENWFPHVTRRNEEKFRKNIHKIFNRKIPIGSVLNFDIRNKKSYMLNNYKLLKAQVFNKRLIIKDPNALFAVEWLNNHFEIHNIVLIRHPAAFVSSLKKNNWTFDFTHFSEQKSLMEGPLEPYRGKVIEAVNNPIDIIEQGILLWNGFYNYVDNLKNTYKDWIYVKHEDISRDPLDTFKRILNQINIPVDQNILSFIKETTKEKNKVDRRDKEVHELYRSSKENIYSWKNRLTSKEIKRIKEGCKKEWTKFYSEQDW